MMRRALGFPFALVVLALSGSTAQAVMIANGDGTGNVTAPADDPGFANVGRCGGGTCVYLGGGWVLTARHVGQAPATFGGITYDYVPGSRSTFVNDPPSPSVPDLAIQKVWPYPPLPDLPIVDRPLKIGSVVVIAGGGRRREVAPIGPPAFPRDGFKRQEIPGPLRWGTNRVVWLRNLHTTAANWTMIFRTGFDRLGDASSTAWEAYAVAGDSGGAAFVRVPGAAVPWALAGTIILDLGWADAVPIGESDWSGSGIAMQGSMNGYTDLFVYRDQIEAHTTAPECSNGVDDDMDGLTDFPADPSCDDAGDTEDSAPGGATASIIDEPTLNVFSTWDQECSAAAIAAGSGCRFSDGFEDQDFINTAFADGTSQNDYWGGEDHGGLDTDPEGKHWVECNDGPINPNRADFGVAGSACTSTMGWLNVPYGTTDGDGSACGARRDGFHAIFAAEGDPSSLGTGTDHYGLRFCFKQAGATSTRCPGAGGGDEPCAAYPFMNRGSNGYKSVVFSQINDAGGLGRWEMQTWNGCDDVHSTCVVEADQQNYGLTNQGTSCMGTAMADQTTYVRQDTTVDELDWRSHVDEWICGEIDVLATATGHVRLYMDPCGRDGMGCAPASQTLVAEVTGDFEDTCGDPRALWNNWWARGCQGEIQMDAYQGKDRACAGCDTNIGWPDRIGIELNP